MPCTAAARNPAAADTGRRKTTSPCGAADAIAPKSAERVDLQGRLCRRPGSPTGERQRETILQVFVASLRLLFCLLLLAVIQPPAAGAANVTVAAPPSLASDAERIRNISLPQLAETLGRAGLDLPAHIDVELIADGDPRARAAPPWVVGLASGEQEIVIFPERVLEYPYDSLE